MTSKAFHGPLYSVIVDDQAVAQFRSLITYTIEQRRKVEQQYASRLGVLPEHVRAA